MTTAATNMHTISLYVRNNRRAGSRCPRFLASLQYRIAGRVFRDAPTLFSRMTITSSGDTSSSSNISR